MFHAFHMNLPLRNSEITKSLMLKQPHMQRTHKEIREIIHMEILKYSLIFFFLLRKSILRLWPLRSLWLLLKWTTTIFSWVSCNSIQRMSLVQRRPASISLNYVFPSPKLNRCPFQKHFCPRAYAYYIRNAKLYMQYASNSKILRKGQNI